MLAVRDVEKGQRTRDALMKETSSKGQIHVMSCDLSDLQSVQAFAGAFNEKFEKCDILVNNAGISNVQHGLTKQGVEIQFGTNHLGHFLLTRLLLDRIEKARGRIVIVASRAHENYTPHHQSFTVPEVFQNTSPHTHTHTLYARSKFANVLFCKRLDRLLRENSQHVVRNGVENIDGKQRAKAVCLHPGLVASNIGRNNVWMGWILATFGRVFGKTPIFGAQTTLHCCLVEELEGGAYYADCKVKKNHEMADLEWLQDELWETSEKLCKNYLK